MNENVIEWLRGQDTAAITLCSNNRYNTKLCNYAKSHPEIQIKRNKDGSIFTHVPLSWVKISPPRKVVMTDEQKQRAAERLRKAREKKQRIAE